MSRQRAVAPCRCAARPIRADAAPCPRVSLDESHYRTLIESGRTHMPGQGGSFLFRAVCAALVAAAAACGGDTSVAGPEKLVTKTPAAGDSSTTTPRPPTSAGPVVAVSVAPKQVTLQQGYYATLVARPVDAKGVLVTGRTVQWRSSDAAVAVSSDTGLVYAKAVGTAKVYATVDGHSDSGTITVTPRVPPPPPPPDTAQTSVAVASFALTVGTVAAVGSD